MAAATIEAPVATDDAIADVARVLVDSGRVVPGLSVDDDGRARSWWWPLPTATQRGLIASIVSDPSPEGRVRGAVACR